MSATVTPTPGVGRPLTINPEAGGGLNRDPTSSGPVRLTVTQPAGVTLPAGFPTQVTLTGGRGSCAVSFPAAGYCRIPASGPAGSLGWTMVDVGVTPNTTPTPAS